MTRLQLVFWLGAILEVVALLIAVIAGDFRNIPFRALSVASLLFFAFATYSRSGISPSGSVFRLFLLSLAVLLLLLFPRLFR